MTITKAVPRSRARSAAIAMLARDAGILVNELGYKLVKAGVSEDTVRDSVLSASSAVSMPWEGRAMMGDYWSVDQ